MQPTLWIAVAAATFLVSTASADGVVVADSWFDDNDRAVQIFGASRDAQVVDNLFTDNATGILLVSGEAYCRAADGSDSSFAVGTPTGATIAGNRVITRQLAFLATAGSTKLTDNQLLPEAYPEDPDDD